MLRNRAGPTALSLWFCKIGFLLAENQHGCSARFSLSLSAFGNSQFVQTCPAGGSSATCICQWSSGSWLYYLGADELIQHLGRRSQSSYLEACRRIFHDLLSNWTGFRIMFTAVLLPAAAQLFDPSSSISKQVFYLRH